MRAVTPCKFAAIVAIIFLKLRGLGVTFYAVPQAGEL
jgi:hypothetical protein